MPMGRSRSSLAGAMEIVDSVGRGQKRSGCDGKSGRRGLQWKLGVHRSYPKD